MMTDCELRTWADAHTRGVMLSSVALAVLRVLEERDAARLKLDGLAERCHGQSEALAVCARRTAKPPALLAQDSGVVSR